MATKLQAYNNDTQLKQDFLAEIRKHQKADRIVQGQYGANSEDFKGCAVGCSIRSLNIIKGKSIPTNNHAAYEPELGMPEWLARLEDTIFEGLPVDDAKEWPLRFASAVPVGAYLEPVKWKLTVYLMTSNIERVLALDLPESLRTEVVDSIRGVLRVAETAVATGKWDKSAARSAESAAWSAARSAAWSAARSARSAARSAAWSAAWSAESAAWSAESAEYVKHADKLVELLEGAEVVTR